MEKDKIHISHSLLMSYLLSEADEKQTADVDNWLSKSEENVKYLKTLELLWIETGKLIPPPISVDTKSAWKNVSSQLNLKTNSNSSKIIRNNNFKYIWRVAAAFIFVLGAYWIINNYLINTKLQTLTGNSIILSDTLSDGSKVSLNKQSTLSYPKKFNKRFRQVNLEGEAFFEVEHDKKRPFIVKVKNANIQVIGTSFNVFENIEKNLVEVYVKTGTVKLFCVTEERDTSFVILNKGEKGSLNLDSCFAQKQEDLGMNANNISWLSNTFVFDGVKLEEVAKFLESYYVIEIDILNDKIKEELLSATFENDDIDDILNVISVSFGLEVKNENHRYIIYEPSN